MWQLNLRLGGPTTLHIQAHSIRSKGMNFHMYFSTGGYHYHVLLVVLFFCVPEIARAFVVTTATRLSAIPNSPQCAWPKEVNVRHAGNTNGGRCSRATRICVPPLLIPKLARSNAQQHRTRSIVYGHIPGRRGERDHDSEHKLADDNCRREPFEQRHDINENVLGQEGIIDDIKSTGERSGDGFWWLREFGNGKADMVGLILSTVLLMTAVEPMSATTHVAVAETRLENGKQAHQAKHNTIEGTHVKIVATKGEHNRNQLAASEEAHPRQQGALLRRDVAPVYFQKVRTVFGGNSAKEETEFSASKTLAKKERRTYKAVQNSANRLKSMPSWGHTFDRNRPKKARSPFRHDATQPLSPRKSNEGTGMFQQHTNKVSIHSSSWWKSDPQVSIAQDINAVEEQAKTSNGDGREFLKALEIKHAELFQDSLPVPVLPESFNRALRETLPRLMPPAMALFLLVSMPVLVLLLKGLGTTLVAIVKYGTGDRFPVSAEGYVESMDVGFGDASAAAGIRRSEGSLEAPGSAFRLFLGGGGDGGRVEGSTLVEPDQVKAKANERAEQPLTRKNAPQNLELGLQVQHVHLQKRGFFDKKHPSATCNGANQSRVSEDELSRQTFGHVGDDAMSAMAMAAMTQELQHIKRSLQNEVKIMKRELLQASDESKRLTHKLHRLEEENRQLEVVVSRLGGQDARRLKAELFSLLSKPSFGDLLLGGEFSEAQSTFA